MAPQPVFSHEEIDPFKFKSILWPDVTFYREQKQTIESVRDNPETFVVAGNQLGV